MLLTPFFYNLKRFHHNKAQAGANAVIHPSGIRSPEKQLFPEGKLSEKELIIEMIANIIV